MTNKKTFTIVILGLDPGIQGVFSINTKTSKKIVGAKEEKQKCGFQEHV